MKTSQNAFLDKLMGSEEAFTMENRIFNLGCGITLIILIFFLIINAVEGFWPSFYLTAFIFICELFFYYSARFKKQYLRSIIANAVISYAVIISNYYINSGINGPSILLFLFTFILIIAATPQRMHFYWLGIHIFMGAAIIIIDLANPGLIKNNYSAPVDRFFDMWLTCLVSVLFIYLVTHYLRNYYLKEKLKAEDSKIRLKAFFETTTNCYMLLNRQQKIVYFNNAADAFIYKAYGKHVTDGDDVEDFVNPAYIGRFKENYYNALNGIKCTEEKLMLYSTIGALWLQFSFAPVIDSEGNITGASFACVDITKRKEHAERIKEGNNALTKIAFVQSHELRQPVSSILGLLNLIYDDPVNNEEYQRYLQFAVDELDLKLHTIVANNIHVTTTPQEQVDE